jgi:hypothetical protein
MPDQGMPLPRSQSEQLNNEAYAQGSAKNSSISKMMKMMSVLPTNCFLLDNTIKPHVSCNEHMMYLITNVHKVEMPAEMDGVIPRTIKNVATWIRIRAGIRWSNRACPTSGHCGMLCASGCR